MKNFLRIAKYTACSAAVLLSATNSSYARLPERVAPRAETKYWSSISFSGKVGVPLGYYDLCMRGNAVCRPHGGKFAKTSSGAVQLTDAMRATISSVNASVNGSMRFVNDPAGRDRWTVGAAKGDCEDFALTKKRRLIAAGFPSSALVVALGKTSAGVDHAVLVVRTDRGDLVLDNLASAVRPWSSSMYRWHSVQSPSDVWTWYKLG